MRAGRGRQAIAVAVVGAAVGYWLFADTVGRYCAVGRAAGEIRFSYWGGFDDHRMWGKVISAFESGHPGLRVVPEWLPLSGYGTKLDQQFIADSAPDVIMFQDEPFCRYVAEQFADLGGFLGGDPETRRRLENCWPSAGRSFQHDGSLHGLPIMGGNVLIYCNLDAFDRVSRHHGEPVRVPDGGWTLEEFVALCQLLTIDADGDGRIDQFGFLQPHWVYYLPFIWSHGARLLEQDPAGGYSLASRWALQGPEAVAALAMYADLRHRWGVTPMPIAYAGQNSDTAFLSGRVAMCVNGPWFQAFLRETALADRYCVVGIPRGPGGSTTRVTWDALCISAKTPAARQADAWQFVRFVLTSEAQEIFASHLRAIPARRSCAGAYTRYGGGVGSPSAVFIENMETARMQPITPAWQSMGRAIRRGFNSVLLDGESRVSAAAAIAALAADPEITGAFGSGG